MISWVEIVKPTKRYLRMVVIRGVSTAAGDLYAMTTGPKKPPVDNEVTDVITGEIHATPDEGTA